MERLKILELFGGIGACSKALKNLGINYEIKDYVEIDKYAVKSFNAINNTNFKSQDICKWNKDIESDLVMHGSPCQDFSSAGKQAGGDKNSGTRSSLMYETIRIVEKLKPKYIIWENVKNILSKKHKHNFDSYIETMNQIGYKSYFQVLNAKDYGIPQNRERVFTISIRYDIKQEFLFPQKQAIEHSLENFLENKSEQNFNKIINNGYYNEYSNFYIKPRGSDGKLINGSYNRIWKKEKYVGTINTTKIQEIGIKDNKGNLRARQLTPRECWRLMGFDDDSFEKASKVNSNAQLYKQAGNSIVVNVLMAIFKQLFDKE